MIGRMRAAEHVAARLLRLPDTFTVNGMLHLTNNVFANRQSVLVRGTAGFSVRACSKRVAIGFASRKRANSQ
jgi:hypothetical protein